MERIFDGANLNSLRYSKQTVARINLGNTRKESDLYLTKWWDYRFIDLDEEIRPMHPMEATHLFRHEYRKALRAGLNRRKDAKLVSILLSKSEKSTMMGDSQRTLNSFWKARRAADLHGVKYDFWCQKAMQFAEQKIWAKPPHPSQLYAFRKRTDPEDFVGMGDFIVQEWEEHCRNSPPIAEGEFYKAKNFSSPVHQDQKSHIIYLTRNIEKASNQPILLAQYIFEERVYPLKTATNRFGQSLVRRARKYV